MGHGIIFVGGNTSEDEREIYSYDGKWKDNWGMYKHKYSRVKSIKGKQVSKNQWNNDETAKCYSLVRIYANELHSLGVRKRISRQLHGKYPAVSQGEIYQILYAYYNCCTETKFIKKGQINTLRLHLEEYLISEEIGAKTRRKFIVAENSSTLKHNGNVDVANVVNSIHRCFLLNKSIPQRMEELALENEVGFTKKELVQLAELYTIILKKIEIGTIEQICIRHKFSFHSKSARILVNRISEFNPKQTQTQNSHKNNGYQKTSKNFNMTGEKQKKLKKHKKGTNKKRKQKASVVKKNI